MRLRNSLLATLAVLAPTTLHAQRAAPLQPGEIIEIGGGIQVKILQCRPVAYGRDCDVVQWQNGQAISNPAPQAEPDLLKWNAAVLAANGRPPRVGTPAATAPRPNVSNAAAPRTPAAGGRVPDGSYQCQIWMGNSYVNLGRVQSVGGRLTPNPLAKVGATITGVAPSAGGITVSYTTARGYRESMDCKRG